MLATAHRRRSTFGDEDGWAFEMKWDGVRTVAYLAGGQVKLLSRKGRDDTAAYFDVVEDLAAIEVETAVLDGEMVVTDPAGRPNFGLLQHRINLTRPADIERAAKTWPAQLMLFDILDLNGRSLIKKPYAERRELLEDLVQPRRARGCRCRRSSTATCRRRSTPAEELKLEGVVAKRLDSVYQPGRRARTWLEDQAAPHQEVVIGGWRPGQGRRDGGIGSLLLGVPTADGLRYVGRVGSGFNDRQLDEIEALLDRRWPARHIPLIDVPREDARDAHWVDAGAGRRGHLRRADRARPAPAPGVARAASRQVPGRGDLGGPAASLE